MKFEMSKYDAALVIVKNSTDGKWGVEISDRDNKSLRLGGTLPTHETDALLTAAILSGLAALHQKGSPARVLIVSQPAKFVDTVRAGHISWLHMPNRMKANLQRAVNEYSLTFEDAEQRITVTLSNWLHHVVKDYSADFKVSTISQAA